MLEALGNALRIKELRNKLLVTAALLTVCRIGIYLPVPGVDLEAIKSLLERAQGAGEGWQKVLLLADLFSGGGLYRASVFALGIMPYISASIIFQLLTAVVPLSPSAARSG